MSSVPDKNNSNKYQAAKAHFARFNAFIENVCWWMPDPAKFMYLLMLRRADGATGRVTIRIDHVRDCYKKQSTPPEGAERKTRVSERPSLGHFYVARRLLIETKLIERIGGDTYVVLVPTHVTDRPKPPATRKREKSPTTGLDPTTGLIRLRDEDDPVAGPSKSHDGTSPNKEDQRALQLTSAAAAAGDRPSAEDPSPPPPPTAVAAAAAADPSNGEGEGKQPQAATTPGPPTEAALAAMEALVEMGVPRRDFPPVWAAIAADVVDPDRVERIHHLATSGAFTNRAGLAIKLLRNHEEGVAPLPTPGRNGNDKRKTTPFDGAAHEARSGIMHDPDVFNRVKVTICGSAGASLPERGGGTRGAEGAGAGQAT